jgi:hypothetical protein
MTGFDVSSIITIIGVPLFSFSSNRFKHLFYDTGKCFDIGMGQKQGGCKFIHEFIAAGEVNVGHFVGDVKSFPAVFG